MISLDELFGKERDEAAQIICGLDYRTSKILTEKAFEAYLVYRQNYLNGVETADLKARRKKAWDLWGLLHDQYIWMSDQIDRRFEDGKYRY